MLNTARKAVASFLAVVSGWVSFVIASDPARITSLEWDLLQAGLLVVVVTYLVPNDPPARWTPRTRGDAGMSELAVGLILGIAGTLAWLAFFGPHR